MTKIKNILPTIFEDVKLFEMESFDDNRGSFKEIFRNNVLDENLSYRINFCQENNVKSSLMVLRKSKLLKKTFYIGLKSLCITILINL